MIKIKNKTNATKASGTRDKILNVNQPHMCIWSRYMMWNDMYERHIHTAPIACADALRALTQADPWYVQTIRSYMSSISCSAECLTKDMVQLS